MDFVNLLMKSKHDPRQRYNGGDNGNEGKMIGEGGGGSGGGSSGGGGGNNGGGSGGGGNNGGGRDPVPGGNGGVPIDKQGRHDRAIAAKDGTVMWERMTAGWSMTKTVMIRLQTRTTELLDGAKT